MTWRIVLFAALICTASAQPVVWFAPLDAGTHPETGGSPQFMELFKPDSPWAEAASHVQVFKVYQHWLGQVSDTNLLQLITDLKRRGIDLAVEYGPLTASGGCGFDTDGYGGETLLAAARRIRSLGGHLRFVAMDEPIYYSTMYSGNSACRWTVERMAANAAQNIAALRAEFPDVQVGDAEPVPAPQPGNAWIDQYQRGLDALTNAFGFPVAFFDAQVLWSMDPWLPDLATFRQAMADRGIPFGVMYTGNPDDHTNAAWLGSAQRHLEDYELRASAPDRVLFQSWNFYPTKLLPETDADSFTSLIDTYLRTRTSLSCVMDGTVAKGSLTSPYASGVALAPVQLSYKALDGPGLKADYEYSGAIPAGVTSILFAVRINTECQGCWGSTYARVFKFQFETDSGVTITSDFSQGSTDWGLSDDSLAIWDAGILQIAVPAGRQLIMNSRSFPVSGGTAYKFTVSGQVSPDSGNGGYFALIFLNDSEIDRFRIPIRTATLPLGIAVTDANGNWSFEAGTFDPPNVQIKALYPGDNQYWPALNSVTRQTVIPTRHKE